MQKVPRAHLELLHPSAGGLGVVPDLDAPDGRELVHQDEDRVGRGVAAAGSRVAAL